MANRLRLTGGGAMAAILLASVLGWTPLAGQRPQSDRATVVHVLNRVTFGPRERDIARVSAIGVEAYIDEQLRPHAIDDEAVEATLAEFETLGMSSADLSEKYFQPARALQRQRQLQAGRAGGSGATPDNESMSAGAPATAEPPARDRLTPEEQQVALGQRAVMNELMQAKVLRATLSERQLQEVLTDFWFNHFNVFVGKGQVRQFLTEYERDVIRPNVFGDFRTLLGKVAHSPAMLFYLDNWQSSAPAESPVGGALTGSGATGRRLTPQQQQRLADRMRQMPAAARRLGRGLNENYARELMELHTLGVDGGYSQKDVVELARILTGWSIDRPQQGGGFLFRPAMHDAGIKTLLGKTFGPAGEAEGEQALDLLAAHPSTARHIARKLAERFVADDPPAALVDRVARTFRDSKGDLRATTRALLLSPEFLGPDHRRSKVKTPLGFVISAVRATDAQLINGQPLVTALQNLGMPLYGAQPPTGYGTAARDWVNTGALLARMNFAVEVVSSGRVVPQQTNGRGAVPAAAPAGRGALAARRGVGRGPVRIDVNRLAPDTSAASQQALIARLLEGQAAESTKQTLARASTPAQLIALTLGSPEFQRH